MSIFSRKSEYAKNLILELDPLAEKLAKGGRKVIKLNRGDPPRFFKTPQYIIDAYIEALKNGDTYYSRSQGLKELVEAVASRYRKLYKMNLDQDDVVVTAGVSEALLFLNNSLINEGDRAVLLSPYYPQYIPRLMIEGGKPLLGRLSMEEGWRLDADMLSRDIRRLGKSRKRVKYMIVTNPHNPTGKVFGRKELAEMVSIAKDNDLLMVSDEIYDEIIYNGDRFTSMGQVAKGVPHVIFNGSSKNFDSTGFRIGFVIVPGKDKVSQSLREKLSNYALLRLSLNTPAQYALAEGINNRKEHDKAIKYMVREIEKRVNFSVDLLRENPYVTVTRPSGAFYILPKLDMKRLDFKGSRDFVVSALMETGVQLTGGYSFNTPENFRIAALPPIPTLEDAITKVNAFCMRHARNGQ